MSAHDRLQELGLTLPPAPQPLAAYVPARLVPAGEGRALLFLSGQVPSRDGRLLTGRVPGEASVEEAREAARAAALNLLAQMERAAGLDAVETVAQLTGYVNSSDDFTGQPDVIDAASELIAQVLGDAGRHSRAAVGVNSLPRGITVEISAVVAVRTA